MAIVRGEDRQVQRTRICRALWIVAMAAIDIEIGAGAVGERLGDIAPVGILRRRRAVRRTGEITECRPMGELILAAARIAIVSIEVPGLGPYRCDRLGLEIHDMTARALIFVRHHVGERFARTVVGNKFEPDRIAGAGEFGLGLRLVPYIGQRLPAVLATH